MQIAVMTAALLAGMGPLATSQTGPESQLARMVTEVQSADYRAARPDLRRLAGEFEGVKDPKLVAYGHYWRGFALWRRALNGFNETPTPQDLGDDLRSGLSSFRAALREQPDAIEPQIGMVGCWGALLFLAGDDAKQVQAILQEYAPVARAMRERGAQNPRALWLVGGSQLSAPPPWGGDAVRAVATFKQGIQAALEESQKARSQPAWIPRWGGAENLMSLAYLYSHSTLANRDLALAYAEGTLVAVPEWHYVRNVLWPQIQAMPERGRSDRP